jgi:hypothetical protein
MSFDWQSKNRCLLSSFTFRFASYSASSCGSLRRCSGCCSSLLTSAKAAARAVEASSGTPTAAGEGDDDDGCMVFFCFSVEERERGAAVFFCISLSTSSFASSSWLESSAFTFTHLPERPNRFLSFVCKDH